jgi:hypothetical protein
MIKILCNIYFKYIEKGEIQEIQLDYGQIISLEFKTTDRADINKPSYGIISNGGNISFKDVFYNGEYIFSKYAQKGYLKNKATIELCLRNTKNGKEETIGTFESEKFEYDNENKIIDLSFVDDLQSWQDIIVEPLECDTRDRNIYSMESIYNHLFSKTPEKYKMLDFYSLDVETRTVIIIEKRISATEYPIFT